MRKKIIASLLLTSLIAPCSVFGQDRIISIQSPRMISNTNSASAPVIKLNAPELLKMMLDLPAPPPPSEFTARFKERTEKFYDPKNPPPDDAPIADLLDYWARQDGAVGSARYFRESKMRPSPEAMRRILSEIEQDSSKLPNYLALLPKDNPEVVEMVRRAAEAGDADSRGALKNWLKNNTNLYADDLLNKAVKAADATGNTANEDELFALADVDFDRARPILERLANDPTQPIAAASAKWALYKRAVADNNSGEIDRWREQLKATVENKNLSPAVRDKAMDALVLGGDWNGRDEWYLGLLSDETLFLLQEKDSGIYTGLTTLVGHEPAEKWIPIMAKLAGDSNQNIRNAAVRNLMRMRAPDSKELYEPLLPWLTDAKWAREVEGERLALIRGLREVIIPEAVPGLIAIVVSEEDPSRSAAALALAKYKDPRAVGALRAALAKEKNEMNRTPLIDGLVGSGGFTDDEMASALETFAVLSVSEEGRKQLNSYYAENAAPLPIQVSLGRFLSSQPEIPDGAIMKSLERLKSLRASNPDAAAVLFEIMQKWQSRFIDLTFLEQLNAGQIDTEIALQILARRKELRERVPGDLRALLAKNSWQRGLGAVVLEDAGEMYSVLGGANVDAKIALLASARLIRAPLPVAEVANYLNDQNKTLALAAERYLESEDSPTAQGFVYAQHPKEVVITGARDSFNPKKVSGAYDDALGKIFMSVDAMPYIQQYGALDQFEEKIKQEIGKNADLLEVYAFAGNLETGQRVVRVFKDRATLTIYDDAARYRERDLTDKEIEAVRLYVGDSKIDTLSMLIKGDERRGGYENVQFTALNRNRGRRVFARTTDKMPAPLDKLDALLTEFETVGTLKLHYYLQDKIKDLEVLSVDDKLAARSVWTNGEDFRILIEDSIKEAEIEKSLEQTDENLEDENIDEYYEKRQKMREANRFAHFSWREFRDGKLGNIVEQPLDARFLPDAGESSISDEDERGVTRAWKLRAGGYEIRNYSYEEPGLYKVLRDQEPLKFRAGNYGEPRTSPDGKWIVVNKYDEATDSYTLVRINMQTNKETKIVLPPKVVVQPLTYLALHNKFLLSNADGEEIMSAQRYYEEEEKRKPREAKIYNKSFLLDAETGVVSEVKGDLTPFAQETYRPLQNSLKKPGFYWVAMPDYEKKSTVVGLYDGRTFTFKPVLNVPEIQFDSMDLWVDEAANKFYFVYEKHLLALPLPPVS